jgi:hypothetical protein
MKARSILFTAVIVLSGSLIHLSAQNTIGNNSPAVETQQARFGNLIDNQVNLKYLNTYVNSKTKLIVIVEEESGDLLYSRRFLKKRNLDVEFDISDFTIGEYTFKLYNKKEIVCSKVISKQSYPSVKKDEVRLAIQENSAFLKTRQAHFSNILNNQVNLQYFDTMDEKRRTMKVRILEESDHLLYSKKYFSNGNLNIGFDISDFPIGNYTFQLYNKNELVCSKVVSKQPEKLVASLFNKEK